MSLSLSPDRTGASLCLPVADSVPSSASPEFLQSSGVCRVVIPVCLQNMIRSFLRTEYLQSLSGLNVQKN